MRYSYLLAALVLFYSCRKDFESVKPAITTATISGDAVVDETQPPVHTPVAAYISPNIGGYYKAIPANYNVNTSVKYPVIIYFTGGGQYGNGSYELYRILYEGLPRNINEHKFPPYVIDATGKKVSFIVITPQLKLQPITATCNLSCATIKSASIPSADFGALLNYIKANFRVDPTRIYTSGMSLGVRTATDLAAAFPTQIAACLTTGGAPIINAVKEKALASGKVAIWHLHNRSDSAVSYSGAVAYINTVNSYKPIIHTKFTTFEDAYLNSVYAADRTSFPATKPSVRTKHDCWTFVLNPNTFKENNLNVFQWMLQYTTLGGPQPPTTPPPAGGNQPPQVTVLNDLTVKLSTHTWPKVYPTYVNEPDGYVAVVKWTKTQGPTAFTIASPNSASTQITDMVAGTYIFRLTITDNKGASAFDEVTITVIP
jgi:dienelactone hydrolase